LTKGRGIKGIKLKWNQNNEIKREEAQTKKEERKQGNKMTSENQSMKSNQGNSLHLHQNHKED
jgi:hypothetical protein